MLLDQLVEEARGRIPADSNFALLTPAGRATLARYFGRPVTPAISLMSR